MAKSVYSVSSVKMGAAGAAGAMGATLADITQIAADSLNVNFPEPALTNITPEDADSPSIVLEEKAPKVITLETINMDIATLPAFFGGAVAATIFTPGVTFTIPEQSFQFTTRPLSGVSQTWKFPRVKVAASISGNLSKKDVLKLKLTVTVLQPEDGSGVKLAEFSITQA